VLTNLVNGAKAAKGFGFTAATAALPLSMATTIYSGSLNIYPACVKGHTDGNFYVGIPGDGTDTIMKFNGTTGAIIWQRSLSRGQSSSSVNVYSIAVDSSNNVYFLKSDGPQPTGVHTFLVKYNSAGTIQWQRRLTTNVFGESNTNPGSVSCSADGSLITVTMNYVAATGVYSGGIITYNSSGTLQWQRKVQASPTSTYIELPCSVYDSSNNVYVSGWAQNNNYGVVLKYNSTGTLQWQIYCTGGKALGIGLDSSNNIYISAGETPNTGLNFNLTKINSSGTYVANADGANGGIPTMPCMAVDASGNTYGMRTEGSNPWETKVSSTNSSLTTRFSNRVTRTAGTTDSTWRSYGSSLLGDASTGTYFLTLANYAQTAGGYGGVIFKFLRAGTDVSLTTQTVSPLTWYVTATASATRSVSVTVAAGILSELAGNVTDAAGGLTDAAGTLSSSTNFA
jgi:hypothetical protein